MNKKVLIPVIAVVLAVAGVVLWQMGVFTKKQNVPGAGMSLNADSSTDSKGAVMQNLYSSLEQQIKSGSPTLKAQMKDGQIDLVDATSGNVVCSIRQVNDQQVSFSSVVARLASLAPEKQKDVEQKVSEFNMNGSGVGTMEYQKGTGDLTLQHKVNPQSSNAEQLAKVAIMFGDKARQQSQKFAELQTASM